jgi:stage IV sporulation protein A
VITEHSTIGVVVTTDGSICGIEREKYVPAEERVIGELKAIGKPFAVIVNSASPQSRAAAETAESIRRKHGVPCLVLDCMNMDEADLRRVMHVVLEDFSIDSVGFFLPDWLQALPESNALKSEVYADIIECFSSVDRYRDMDKAVSAIMEKEEVIGAERGGSGLGEGKTYVTLMLPRELYYRSISEETGVEIRNDGELFSALSEMSAVKGEYDRIREALQSVREKGYGVVLPDMEQMQLEEPKIVRQGGKYSVRLKANAPAIHLMMTNIETEVTPAIGGETASEDIINFLLQGFDGDINRIWQSNIFGKSLYDIACESLTNKICSLNDNARSKLQHTLERIINEGSAGLICILL